MTPKPALAIRSLPPGIVLAMVVLVTVPSCGRRLPSMPAQDFGSTHQTQSEVNDGPEDPERQAACDLLPGLSVRTRLYLQCFDVSGVARRGLKQIGGCLLVEIHYFDDDKSSGQ